MFECFSDDMKDAVLEVVLKSAISRQGEIDGWNPVHIQKARNAVCNAARDLLDVYEENFFPGGNRVNVLEEEEVMEAQSNLLNSVSNNNSNNSNSNSNTNSSNNSNNNTSNSNNSNSNTNQNGGKTRRRRKAYRRRRATARKN